MRRTATRSFFSTATTSPASTLAGPGGGAAEEGFRVIIPDQIGYGRSSKPTTIRYNFSQWARNTKLLLDSLKIEKAMIVGHSMGGMLAARFATQYPATTERLVLYNPIGLTDGRYDRPLADVDEAYASSLNPTYQSTRASLMRYVAHNTAAWNDVFETLHQDPLFMDAQRRMAAACDGADADQPGPVHGSRRVRLGPHHVPDVRLRRCR